LEELAGGLFTSQMFVARGLFTSSGSHVLLLVL
jgi:hypothetical protein